MSIKEDVQDAIQELEDIKNSTNARHSLAWDILTMQAKDNKRLFIANIIEGIALIIALFIIFLR